MNFFGFKNKKSASGRTRRFQQDRFQVRIKRARTYTRAPKILPDSHTGVALRKFRRSFNYLGWALLLFVALAVYFLVFSNYFSVKNVSVSGTEQLDPQQVAAWIKDSGNIKLYGLVPANNFFVLSKSRVEGLLFGRTSKILRVTSTSRVWPDGLRITLEERKPVGIWESASSFYFFSQDNIIVEQLPPGYATTTLSFTRFVDLTAAPVEIGKKLSIEKITNFVKLISGEWEKRIGGYIAAVKFSGQDALDLYVNSSDGWVVFFDLNSDAARQMRSLQLILDKEVTREKIKTLSYVDLRLSTTAYYCLKNEPCSSAQAENP